MEISVSQQSILFLWSVVFGFALGFLYDIFRVLRREFQSKTAVTFVEDIIFVLAAAVLTFTFIYRFNAGEIRGFILIGAGLGAGLYFLTLSRLFLFTGVKVLDLTCTVVAFLLKILLFPVRLIVIPIWKLLKKFGRFVKKCVRSLGKRLVFWLKGVKICLKKPRKRKKSID